MWPFGFGNKYPYTNFHELNLDWILDQIGHLTKSMKDFFIDTTLIIKDTVNTWLDDHPEATTTVQDGALTEPKFTESLKLKTIKDYVTPQMFGAVGDGSTDDGEAIQDAFDAAYTAGKPVHFISNYYTSVPLTLKTELIGNNNILITNENINVITLQHNTTPNVNTVPQPRISDLKINAQTTGKVISIIDGVRQFNNILNRVTIYNHTYDTSGTLNGTGLYIEMNPSKYMSYNNFSNVIIYGYDIGIHLNAIGTGFIQCNNFTNFVIAAKQFILEEGNETNGNIYIVSLQGGNSNRRSITKGIIKTFIIDANSQTFEIKNQGGFEGFTQTLGLIYTPETPKVYYNGIMNGSGGYIYTHAGTSLDVYYDTPNYSTVGKGYMKHEDNFIGNTISGVYTVSGITISPQGTKRGNLRRDNGFILKHNYAENSYFALENIGVTADKLPTIEMIIADVNGSDASGLPANHVRVGIKTNTGGFIGFEYNHTSSQPTQLLFVNTLTETSENVTNINGNNMTIANAQKLLFRMRFLKDKIKIMGAVEDYNAVTSVDSGFYNQYRANRFEFDVDHGFSNQTIEPVIYFLKDLCQVNIEYLKIESTRVPAWHS